MDLSEKEKADFDYIKADDLDSHDFIRYRGALYDPSEFMRCPESQEAPNAHANNLTGWHGYQSDSFFSGVVIRYSDDCEQYQIGTYIS